MHQQRGANPDRVGAAKLGINVTRFRTTDDETRTRIRSSVLSVPDRTLVLVSSARLDSQKRPLLVPDILAEVNRRLTEMKRVGTQCEVDRAVIYSKQMELTASHVV